MHKRPLIADRRVSLEETLCLISIQIAYDNEVWDKIYATSNTGQMGVIEIFREWAHEFEKIHEKREWDGEWYDEIDKFLDAKLIQLKIK